MLIDTIRADQRAARLARDTVRAGLLTTLIGEIESKVRGNANVKTDDDVETIALSQIKKFIDGATEMVEIASSRPESANARLQVEQSKAEIAILDSYRPKQMSEDEIKAVVNAFAAANPDAKIGQFMGHFKANHSGQYDGALVQRVIKGMNA